MVKVNTEDTNYYSFSYSKMDETRNVVSDYIKYRLAAHNYTWDNGGQGNVTPTEVQRAMRSLGDEFEEKFRNRFDAMIQQITITEDNAYETFNAIVNETFSDDVNWGRIVAMFGFAGKFSILCIESNLSQMVGNVVDWTTTYVDSRLSGFMREHNGWQGFLAFYEGGQESKKDISWPNFKTICGYAAAGIGFLTLGAILTQKSS